MKTIGPHDAAASGPKARDEILGRQKPMLRTATTPHLPMRNSSACRLLII
jgi:hypothetical protein